MVGGIIGLAELLCSTTKLLSKRGIYMPSGYSSDANLPEGFIFPAKYLEFMASDPHPTIGAWHFFSKYPEDSLIWFNELRRLYPTRSLIPFARIGGMDDVACFDASVKTDDPVVHYVHAYASAGWEDYGNVKNFEEWLRLETERYTDWNEDDGVYPD